MSTTNRDRLQRVSEQLRHIWLVWGILPVAIAIVVTLLVVAVVSPGTDMTVMTVERRFQVILAIGAALFLIGFSLDSHWTNAQKLARRLALAAGLDLAAEEERARKHQEPNRFTQQQLAAQADLVSDSILASTWALTVIGAAIACTAILTAAAHLGLSYAIMVLILSVAYQLFVLSRHTYYKEIIEVAEAGHLLIEPKPEKAQRK